MKLVTVEELATICNLKPANVRRLAREKKIPAYRFDGVWRFQVDEVLASVKGER